jgi:hypothetical protein
VFHDMIEWFKGALGSHIEGLEGAEGHLFPRQFDEMVVNVNVIIGFREARKKTLLRVLSSAASIRESFLEGGAVQVMLFVAL